MLSPYETTEIIRDNAQFSQKKLKNILLKLHKQTPLHSSYRLKNKN